MSWLLRIGGKFLASKLVTVILMTALAGIGSYVVYVIKDRGALQERLAQEQETNRAWAEHVAAIRKLQARFDAYDQELAEARQHRAELARTVDREIEGLRREIPSVDDYLSRRAPPELVRVLCEDGTIAATAPECAGDP